MLLYLSPPICDYIIFRKLWRIPIEGLGALIKKRIANDVVLGYSGEAYFYAWARQRAQMVAAPFGAVKDVTILSAMAGNLMTLAMTALALPWLPPLYVRPMLIGMGVVVAMSLPFLIFSRRVFSLERKHVVVGVRRAHGPAGGGQLLIALAWHFALPGIAIGAWLILSATRLMVSRLPFIPNKELVFSTVAIAVLGENNDLSSLIAFTAAAILLTHVVLAAGFRGAKPDQAADLSFSPAARIGLPNVAARAMIATGNGIARRRRWSGERHQSDTRAAQNAGKGEKRMLRIDRRSLLMTATLGLGAYAVPGFAQIASVAALRGFTHSVASGEPASDSMLLWTRFVPADGKPIHLIAEVSTTADFARDRREGHGDHRPVARLDDQDHRQRAKTRHALFLSLHRPRRHRVAGRADQDLARRPAGAVVQGGDLLLLEHAVRLLQRLCPCRGARRSRPRDPPRRLFLRI